MIWQRLLSRQSRRPSGLVGRLLMGPYLDRANARINRLVFDCLEPEADARVLEVGFGGGDLLFRIASRLESGRVDGIELSPQMVAAARRRAARLGLDQRVRLHRGSLERLPFAMPEFDRACSVHTLYFWPDLGQGLAELARVLKPGARLVLGFSSARALAREGWEQHGFRTYTAEQVGDACEAQGFAGLDLRRIDRAGGGFSYALCATRA